MNKHYYIVPEGSRLGKIYTKWEENERETNSKIIELFAEHGINSDEYVPLEKTIAVKLDGDAKKSFESQLTKQICAGVCTKFKVNSPVAKAYRDKGIKRVPRPLVSDFMGSHGYRWAEKIFRIDGVIYARFEDKTTDRRYACPDDLTEIKASEFYKILEEYKDKKEE